MKDAQGATPEQATAKKLPAEESVAKIAHNGRIENQHAKNEESNKAEEEDKEEAGPQIKKSQDAADTPTANTKPSIAIADVINLISKDVHRDADSEKCIEVDNFSVPKTVFHTIPAPKSKEYKYIMNRVRFSNPPKINHWIKNNNDRDQVHLVIYDDKCDGCKKIQINKNKHIDMESMRRLKPNIWLNDEILNNFFDLLAIRDQQGGKNCLLFSSTFYEQLLNLELDGQYIFQKVKGLSMRFRNNHGDIIHKAKIFIPVNISKYHWALVIIFFTGKKSTTMTICIKMEQSLLMQQRSSSLIYLKTMRRICFMQKNGKVI